jgi:hypothetical protein
VAFSPDARRLLACFIRGVPPPPRLAADCLAGLDSVIGEWKLDLDDYVRGGGSLLRIVVAPAGSGKTHLGEALKSLGAQRGFLVCQIDAQAQGAGGDDLLLYRAFCEGLILPSEYLDTPEGEDPDIGLRSVLENIAERMSGSDVVAALRSVRLPLPLVRDAMAAAVDAFRERRVGGKGKAEQGWAAMVAALGGSKHPNCRSLAALRREYGREPFKALKRLPGKRDARLWMESLLLALRPLGFTGAVIVVDAHDDHRHGALDSSIRQLRRKLDRLAEGHLPGTFVLYLVLDDFPLRVSSHHMALRQRIEPIVPGTLTGRLMTNLTDLRDVDGADFLLAVADRLHLAVMSGPVPKDLVETVSDLAARHTKLSGPDTRAFVKAFAQKLEE